MGVVSGRAPKRRLSPLQREILWLLEESGAEDIIVILNTLRVQGSYSDMAQLLGEVANAMRRLWLDGLLELSEFVPGPVRSSH